MAITPDWEGRQGDTEKAFPFVCRDANGPVDISTATDVKFHMTKKVGQMALINADATDVDYAHGEGRYEWADGETDDLLGFYYAEIQVTFPSGKVRTFPEAKDEYAILYFSKQIA